MPTFALHFSRPGAEVIAQYFKFLRLGRDGYRRVHQGCRDTAMWLAEQIDAQRPFALISDASALPVVAFRIDAGAAGYTVYDVAAGLREHGWLAPAYPMPPAMDDAHVLPRDPRRFQPRSRPFC